jgi:ankyrin repeat protein
MESPNERMDIDPIIDKIRSGEISVIEAVAEELPDVFRTHVVPKLCLKDTLDLARVNKSFYETVWSAEGFGSIQNKCPIWHLLNTNNSRGLRAYIRAGVDLEQRYTPILPDTVEGTRPLHFAIQLGHSECAVLLIEAGCDVNVCCRLEGANPLCMALSASTSIDVTAIVSALVEAGADVNARFTAFDPRMSSLEGYTPLALAAHGFHHTHVDDLYEIPKILLDAGADPNATFDCGDTALHSVARVTAD